MNICFLLGHLTSNGGIGRVTTMLANQLVTNSDIQCHILSYYNTKKPLFYTIHPQVKLDYLMQDYSSMARFMLNGGHKRLEQYLTDNSIDVLVACGVLFFPISVQAAKGLKTRCICWEHTAPESNCDYRGQAAARKFGIKRSDINVVISKRALATYTEKYHCKNTLQIYNPIDQQVVDCAGEYKTESKKIVSVGRLSYPKNFSLAIEAASEVFDKFPDWSWDIYGEGEERAKLESKIRELGLEGKVRLKGQVDNLYQLYGSYSFMVMTSRYEGFPMSLLEGLGSRLPLISFDIETGPSEMIQDGINGFLVEANDKDALIKRICEMISDENKRAEMSRNSRNIAQCFSIDTIVNQWIELFRML